MSEEEQRSPVSAEDARQGAEIARWERWWMEATIWSEHMVSALDNGVKGGKWFSLVDKVYRLSTLEAAWRRVERNKGSAGVDGQGIERFATQAERYLAELHEQLKDGRYQPSPVKRVEIPKGDGKTRPLGIPTVKDRIVQTALKLTIEPIFETQFRKGSYGFRPGRSCKEALREVDRLLQEGHSFVVDADLKSYFDTIPHDRLMDRVAGSISDGSILALIESFLRQDIMKEMERWRPTTGTPQGAVISPLLANIYLHPLDLLMEASGYQMVRYADDFVILCRTQEEAQAAFHQVEAWVTTNGLVLHPDKTRIGDSRQPGQGFDFLGYRFEAGHRFVRKKSRKAFKDRVRAKTGRSRGVSVERIIAELNPMLRGWFSYFQNAVPSEFRLLDGFIRRRLRAILRKQNKRPGFGRNPNDHLRWPNAYFASLGLFALSAAQYQARRSR